jgi:hypothetical protein
MRIGTGCTLIVVALSSAACHTMRPVALDQVGGVRPTSVVVKRDHQQDVVVSNPQVFGDTLVGFVNRKYEVLPPASFNQLLMKQPAPGRTAALVAAGMLGLVGAAFLVASSGSSAPQLSSKCEIFESGTNVECPQ